MKKQLSLCSLMLFACLFVVGGFSNLRAQVNVDIGPTTGSTSYFYGPYYRSSATSSFDYSKYAYIYTASELGIPAGATITSIAWFKASGTITGNNTFSIWLENNTASSLVTNTTWDTLVAGATQVYTSTTDSFVAPNDSYESFTLSTPFVYTGGTLQILTDHVMEGTALAANKYYYSSAPGMALGKANSSVLDGTTLLTSTSYGSNRPTIRITYTAGSACTGTPEAGGINAPLSQGICAGSPISLSDTGSTLASGLTYQWQQRNPSGTGTWTDISGATSPGFSLSAGITNATDFRMYVVCTASGTADTTTPVTFTINAPSACYCDVSGGGNTTRYLSNVAINGATGFTKTSSTPAAYEDFTVTDTASQVQGGSVTFNMTASPASTYGYAIWIDFNQNGDFSDPGEEVYNSASYLASASGTFTIPLTAMAGNTRMRVVGAYIPSTPVPCSATTYTAYQDYTFNVIALTSCTGTPDAGTVLGAATQGVCAGTAITLTDSGATTGTGITYQWQQRDPSGSGTWTDITGANSSSLSLPSGITNATDFRMYTVCTNSSTADTSNVVTYTMNAATSCYCVPSSGTTTDDITNFTLSDLNNTSVSDVEVTSPGYSDYTSTVAAANLVATLSYTPSLTSGTGSGNHGAAIWIDYNDDGMFDTTEKVSYVGNTIAGGSTVSLPSFVVQSTPGNHRLRVQYTYYQDGANLDPCNVTTTYSETEDYMVNVTISSACTGTPDAGTVLGAATQGICAGTAISLTDSGATVSPGITYQWQQRSPAGTGTWTDITGATLTTLSLPTGVTDATDFRMYTLCTNSSTADTSNMVTFTMNAPTSCYCTPTYTYGCNYNEDLNYVELSGQTQTLSNTASGCTTGGYADNTSMTHPDLAPGLTYTINIGTSYTSPQYIDSRAWIDYNGDGLFDATEEIANTNGNGLTAPYSSFTFTVPVSATAGSYRMRVRNVDGGGATIDPCTNEYYGEAEDYMVDIIALAPCTGTPDAGTILGPDTFGICPLNAFSLTDSGATLGSGLTYQWQQRDPSGTGTWTDITGANTTMLNITAGISSATDYRFYIVCSNSSSADTSNVITVTMNPPTSCYCTPIYTTGCTFGDDIDSVALAGETVSLTNGGTGCSTGSYTFYDSLAHPDLYPDSTYSLTVATSYSYPASEEVRAWIDYNNNGTFEATEEIANTQDNGLVAGGSAFSFTVPSSQAAGTYRMRVRLVYSGGASIDPCTSVIYGETEDYLVDIISSCTTPDSASITVSNVTSSGATVTWNAVNPAPTDGYQYYYNLTGTAPDATATPSGSTVDTTAIITGINPNDTVYVWVRSACDSANSSFSSWSSMVSFATLCDTPLITLDSTAVICNGTNVTLHSGVTDPNSNILWSDGSTAEGLIVNTVGTYSVTVTNQYGCTASASSVVTASETPVVNGITATEGANNTYTFSASGAQNVDTYNWNFGDGNTSTDANTSNTYTQDGDYTVTLVVSNACGSDTATTIIHIGNTGVNQIGLDNQLTLYPNPAKDIITLKNESKYQMESVIVTNVLGQVIYQAKTQNATTFQLNVHNYASGTYSVKVMLNNGSWVVRKFEILK